jgi:hypothetical protein
MTNDSDPMTFPLIVMPLQLVTGSVAFGAKVKVAWFSTAPHQDLWSMDYLAVAARSPFQSMHEPTVLVCDKQEQKLVTVAE